jgi:hypothetical protein
MVGPRKFINPNQTQVAPLPNERLGFQKEREVVATRGVKIKNKNAEQVEQQKLEHEDYKKKFDTLADKTIQYHNEQSSRAVDCVSRFLKLSDDKTLLQNRGSVALDVEREIRQDLIQLALDLNNDENETDNGKGSVVVLSAVTKIILMYRNRLNQLECDSEQFKNELRKKSNDRDRITQLENELLQLKIELRNIDSSSRPIRQDSDADHK